VTNDANARLSEPVETIGRPAGATEILAFESNYDSLSEWRRVLSSLVPDLEVVKAAEIRDPARVKYAMVWNPPHGFFQRFQNLSWIVNLGAGVDRLVARDDLPAIPISRLSDPQMTRMMASYVLFAVHARDIPQFERAQRRRQWHKIWPRQNHEISVGVLGLGELGAAAAAEIARLGFATSGWSRSQKSLPGRLMFFRRRDINALPRRHGNPGGDAAADRGDACLQSGSFRRFPSGQRSSNLRGAPSLMKRLSSGCSDRVT
jgi:hypothetical protein